VAINVPPSESGQVTGSLRSEVLPGVEEQHRRDAIAESRGVEIFDPDDLELLESGSALGRLFGHVPTDTLWRQVDRNQAGAVGREGVACLFEGRPPTVRYLRRQDGSLSEYRARQRERAEAVERSRAQQAADLEARRAQATTVTFDDIAHDGVRLTLRQAAEAVRQAGGRVYVQAGRVVVALPPGTHLTMGVPSTALRAAKRLYVCEAVILAGLKQRKSGDVDPGALPDAFALPNGTVAP
jgi:hypothetical protein